MKGWSHGRASGVLLHPTSLPGGGIGDLGRRAYAWVDWLASAEQRFWQILPLIAVDQGGSPYNGLSALAGNPLLIDLEQLAQDGLLDAEDARWPGPNDAPVDYPAVTRWKEERFARAHRALRDGAAPALATEMESYRTEHADWVEDYALFRALRDRFGGLPWTAWPPPLRDREPEAMSRARSDLEESVELRIMLQFLFDRQWSALRSYANQRSVRVIGDIPIFVAHDSADVWAHPDLFELDPEGRPRVVSGVPPDYFSETGQRWGNPLYRWDVLAEHGFGWWIQRFRRTLQWVDVVRVDHFRGFESYWEIPAEEETAVNGQWREGPGASFFRALERELGDLPVIAEDLGLITPEVEALRDEVGYPGMRVVQFAFDGDPLNPHLPGNYVSHSVVYTGTHDNDTLRGWWDKASDEEREAVSALLENPAADVPWPLVEVVLRSPAELAILPVQDVLGLGSVARMNTPGTRGGNWSWRLAEPALSDAARDRLRALTVDSGRAAAAPEPLRPHHDE